MRKKDIRREIRHERELRRQSERYAREALRLQAVEYQRRLEDLNGEAGRIRDVLAQTIPREVFENYKEERDKALDAALKSVEDKRAASLTEVNSKLDGTSRAVTGWQGSIRLIVGIASFVGFGGLLTIAALLMRP